MNIKVKMLEKLDAELAALQEKRNRFLSLPDIEIQDDDEINPTLFGNQIDFDNLSHDKIIKVIKAVGGKWDKIPSAKGGRIDYSTNHSGVTIRCWAGEPPPNCKIVEVLETVPAVPERVITVRKLVCK